MTLRDRIVQSIRDQQLMHVDDRVLVGVSGGADSVALLHLLAAFRASLHLDLIAVHIDHRLRPASGEDASFVERLAGRLQVPAVVVRRDVGAEAARRGLSIEDAARQVRYEIFRDVGCERSAHRVALAHTADDQAETVLLRALRGAGPTGLAAIPVRRPLGDMEVVRPLLGIWRRELLGYLREVSQDYRDDASNADTRFLRNRVRLELLPVLESYNPNVKAALVQLADQCRVDAAFLHDETMRQWHRLVKPKAGAWTIRLEPFRKQPEAVRRALVRLVIQQLQGDLTGFEFRHWLELAALFDERPVGSIVDLPGSLQFSRETAALVTARRDIPSSV